MLLPSLRGSAAADIRRLEEEEELGRLPLVTTIEMTETCPLAAVRRKMIEVAADTGRFHRMAMTRRPLVAASRTTKTTADRFGRAGKGMLQRSGKTTTS